MAWAKVAREGHGDKPGRGQGKGTEQGKWLGDR